MKNHKLKLTLSVIVVILIAGLAIFAILKNASSKSKEADENGLYPEYEISVSSGDSATVFSITFDDSTMTYSENIAIGDTDYSLDSGSYQVEGDKVICTSQASSSTEENTTESSLVVAVNDDTEEAASTEEATSTRTFTISGEYLVADGYFYEGEIPSTETFDATCTYEGESNDITVTFEKDGSFTYESSSGSEVTGTYESDGEFIHVDTDDDSTLEYLIVDGQITNSYYKAVK